MQGIVRMKQRKYNVIILHNGTDWSFVDIVFLFIRFCIKLTESVCVERDGLRSGDLFKRSEVKRLLFEADVGLQRRVGKNENKCQGKSHRKNHLLRDRYDYCVRLSLI